MGGRRTAHPKNMGAGFFLPKLRYQKFGEFSKKFSKIIEFVVEKKNLPKTPNYFVEKTPNLLKKFIALEYE